ncbi:hypothetical protein C2134_08875 [Chromobacterium sinusclupearum]|uniref:Alginate export domain-containing protein n=1 Tax=Chromobacterium sinusclupearum TaxID=2077146 RepID=A0A2K4MPE0_9NEIS|nr:hypothetical protein [Chromobacterium sinusclupearum]POA98961.1 hypothetical protein C2134_08875 [Chromobacterium sinusclupearum]
MRAWLMLVLAALPAAAWADDDAAALQLADQTPAMSDKPRDLKLLFESAAIVNQAMPDAQRLSFDLRWDGRLSPDWRAVFSDRLDQSFVNSPQRAHGVNTLREAYLSREFGDQNLLDIGRVNTRYGVGVGYNPTDFLGEGTVRSVVSADQESLRENRLGNAMLRWQKLWDRASLTGIWSPKLADAPSGNGLSADWGASNPRERMLLAFSYQFSESWNPQWLAFRQQGGSPQLGFNLSHVLTDSTVAYVEWAGGQADSDWRRWLGEEAGGWRNRLALGSTWTGASKLSLTLEGQYDGAAPEAADWDRLRQSPFYGSYRQSMANSTSLLTRRAALLRASWQDALVDSLDLTAMRQTSLVDHSGMNWAEARYHWPHVDLALQWQRFDGGALTHYGAAMPQQSWQLVFDYFY